MTVDEALEALASHPHAWRYRQLCGDGNPDAEQRESYRAAVISLARGEPVSTPMPPVTVHYGASVPQPGRCCG